MNRSIEVNKLWSEIKLSPIWWKECYTMKAPRTEHVRIQNIRDCSNNNIVERLYGTIRQRNNVLRGLDYEATAQTIMDGMRIYYNFLRPHSPLNGKTSAQKANIECDEAKWLFLIKKASKNLLLPEEQQQKTKLKRKP